MLLSSKIVTWSSHEGHRGGSNIESCTGKELRRLHNCLIQHLRALKAMGYKPSASFITSLIQLKLDQNMMFECQKYTQEKKRIPHWDDTCILTFMDMRAQASEMLVQRTDPKKYQGMQFKRPYQQKTSLLADAGEIYVVCKAAKHPLYLCSKFRPLLH